MGAHSRGMGTGGELFCEVREEKAGECSGSELKPGKDTASYAPMGDDVQLSLALLAIVASMYLGIFLHECGHLFAALLVGWKPVTFSVGTGRRITVFRHGDFQVQLGWLPGGGAVSAPAETASWFRFKWFVFSISGPVFTLAGIGTIGYLLHRNWDSPSVLPWAHAVVPIVLGMQTGMFFGAIFPRKVRVYGREYASDGLQAWYSLSLPAQKITRQVTENQTARIAIYLERGEEARAMKMLETLARNAEWQPLQMRMLWIHWLFKQGKSAEAEAAIEALQGDAGVLGISRSEVLDGLACLPLFYGHSHLRERALGYVDEAIRENPSAITLKGTKGSLLVEEGRYHEGLELLEEVMTHTKADNDRAIASYYIALATLETGRWEKGRELLERAVKRYPDCVVRPHVTQRILEELKSSRAT